MTKPDAPICGGAVGSTAVFVGGTAVGVSVMGTAVGVSVGMGVSVAGTGVRDGSSTTMAGGNVAGYVGTAVTVTVAATATDSPVLF